MNFFIATTEAVTESDFGWGVAEVRNLLHLISVIVWVGGQVLVGALIPVVRKLGEDAPQKVAKQFGRVGFPALYAAIITGVWNLGENWGDATSSWKTVLLIKVGIVAVSGITAWLHTKAQKPSQRMQYAMITLLLSLGAIALGIGLGN